MAPGFRRLARKSASVRRTGKGRAEDGQPKAFGPLTGRRQARK
jgi:hypothetical protein